MIQSDPLLLSALYKYFPDESPQIEKEVRSGQYLVFITKRPSSVVPHVNLFIWDEIARKLLVTENVFPEAKGMGSFSTGLQINDAGEVIAYAAIGCNMTVNPKTGKVTPIIVGRPW